MSEPSQAARRAGTTPEEWPLAFGRISIELKRRMTLSIEEQRTRRLQQAGLDRPKVTPG